MSDPLRDLERRVDALASRLDLSDQQTRSDIAAMKDDIAQLRDDHRAFVARSWGIVILVLTAAAGGLVSIITSRLT